MKAISKDGTAIAYDRTGQGPAVILVDGALCSRAFGPMPKLAPLLARQFTVYTYDRRGRGESGDTPPYSKEREIEDLAALMQEAGGSASLVGLSSGGALALETAARGLRVDKVVAYEPPYVSEGGGHDGAHHEQELKDRIAAGRPAEAVKYFMRTMVGLPAPVVVMMQCMPWIWGKLKAVAHTLPYDAAIMGAYKVPQERFSSVRVPTLALHGSKTDARLQAAVRAVADAVPGARYGVLAGQTHNVKLDVLTPAVVEFLTARS